MLKSTGWKCSNRGKLPPGEYNDAKLMFYGQLQVQRAHKMIFQEPLIKVTKYLQLQYFKSCQIIGLISC